MTQTGPTPRVAIALTGGIASGKTTVANLLAARGAYLVDSDLIAREVVEPGTDGLAAVVERFGDQVVAADGSLDRAALGRIVFGDPTARVELEAITHPRIRRRSAELVAAAPERSVVIQVIPLLVETGQAARFDEVIVVDASEDEQVARLCARDGVDESAARARLAAQATRAQRLAVATRVVDNTDGAEDLGAQVDRLWDALTGRVAGSVTT
ncbi:dephospho-CoA kinase [Aestuariimicrobium sp. Y1814]|uniref:dephospho-CoA kinase n=1 Tax=Aestuariimicrobium sp. Y1814 TaxID=3418742 RepID=UPI003DA6E14B